MANMTESAKRYRLQVPAADESVQKWLAAQINISNSLRLLIREDIQKNGFTDMTCRSVEQGPKRGRPTNAELERRAEEELVEKDVDDEVKNDANNGTDEVVNKSGQTAVEEKPKATPQTPIFGAKVPKNPNMDMLDSLLG